MKVSVDRKRCSGHARCWDMSPEVLTLDNDGYSDVGTGKHVPARFEADVRVGVAECPERALTLTN